MKLSKLLFVTLTVCFHSVFSLDCTTSPGISFIPCQNPSGSSSGGSGGTGGAGSQDNPIAIQPCTDIQYNGGQPQRYTVANQGLPEEFELLFEELNIPDGETLLIKTFKCDPNNECKIGVIDSTAAIPLSVSINKHTFALASSSSSVSATFKVNYECADPCEPLSSIGYNLINDHKWLKIYTPYFTTAECESKCDTDDTRIITVKSDDDVAVVLEAMNVTYRSSASITIMGLKQDSLTQYTWSDGTVMNVDRTNGNTDLPGGFKKWVGDYSYDKSDAALDVNICFSYYYNTESFSGWNDIRCTFQYQCICECKY